MHSPCSSPAGSISIHALREEGDRVLPNLLSVFFIFLSTPSARRATIGVCNRIIALVISIHALREEGDPGTMPHRPAGRKFLSTPSARRATGCPRRTAGKCF